ncbi:hypothetical protein GCM10027418_30540 [Mariniluteicoccus endophyticus]
MATVPADAVMPAPSDTATGHESVRTLTVRNTLAAVAAVFISVILHEYAHAVAQVSLGVGARVRAIDSSPLRELGPAAHALTASAGPLFSIVFGAAVFFGTRGLAQGFGRLLGTWVGLASMQNFFGYLMISPIPGGDTAVVIEGLGLPSLVAFVLIPIGVAGMFWLATLMGREAGRHAPDIGRWRAICFYSWIAATLAIAVVYLVFALVIGYPAKILPLVVAGPATALVFAPMGVPYAKRHDHGGPAFRTGSTALCAAVAGLALVVVAYHAFAGVTLG